MLRAQKINLLHQIFLAIDKQFCYLVRHKFLAKDIKYMANFSGFLVPCPSLG